MVSLIYTGNVLDVAVPCDFSPMQRASFRNHKATPNETITAEVKMVTWTVLLLQSSGALVHFKARGNPSRNTLKQLTIQWFMASPLYCLSRIQSSLCWGLRRLDLAFGEPWGPEETLRVVKRPLFHNSPAVYTIPPNPLSPFPLGSGTQTWGSGMINSTSLSTGLHRPGCG